VHEVSRLRAELQAVELATGEQVRRARLVEAARRQEALVARRREFDSAIADMRTRTGAAEAAARAMVEEIRGTLRASDAAARLAVQLAGDSSVFARSTMSSLLGGLLSAVLVELTHASPKGGGGAHLRGIRCHHTGYFTDEDDWVARVDKATRSAVEHIRAAAQAKRTN
jgi:hypothetical protein